MFLIDLHCRVAVALIFFATALGIWGIFAFLRGMGVTGSYLGALIIGEILIVAEAVVGVALLVSGNFPVDGLHLLYGVVTPLAWAAVFVYTRGAQTKREMMIYALMSFFVAGLGIRGIMTGGAAPVCLPF